MTVWILIRASAFSELAQGRLSLRSEGHMVFDSGWGGMQQPSNVPTASPRGYNMSRYAI